MCNDRESQLDIASTFFKMRVKQIWDVIPLPAQIKLLVRVNDLARHLIPTI